MATEWQLKMTKKVSESAAREACRRANPTFTRWTEETQDAYLVYAVALIAAYQDALMEERDRESG